MKPTCFSSEKRKGKREKSDSFSSEKLMFSKRGPFAFQKESFYSSKGVLLLFKRSPFTFQKEPFCNPKGLLLFCMLGTSIV